MATFFPWFEASSAEAFGPDRYPLHNADPFLEAQRLIGGVLLGAGPGQRGDKTPEPGDLILEMTESVQAQAVPASMVRLLWNDSLGGRSGYAPVLRSVLGRLLRRRLPLDASQLSFCFGLMTRRPALKRGGWPLRALLRQTEWYIDNHQLDDALRIGLEALQDSPLLGSKRQEARAMGRRVAQMLGAQGGPQAPLDEGEWWSECVLEALGGMEREGREAWESLLAHAGRLSGTQPSARWQKAAERALAAVGQESFRQHFEHWAPKVGRAAVGSKHHRSAPSDRNGEVLKGLVWCCALVPSGPLTRALCELAEACFRKLPEVGARCPRVGNACLGALAGMGWSGMSQLVRLKHRLKYISAKRRIEETIEKEALRRGASTADLEELAVPDCGLDPDTGERLMDVGGFVARLHLSGPLQAELQWLRADGSPQKSVPSRLKREHPEALARARGALRELQALLPTQRDRLEGLWLTDRYWSYPQWRARYLEHPVLASLARDLVWQFQRGPRIETAIWSGGDLVDALGQTLGWLDERTTVHLWHPVDTHRAVQQSWRRYLVDHELTQPFKQAHREIYPLTEIERGELSSLRYSGHFLKQHQLAALCKQRGWRYQLQGPGFGAPVMPSIELSTWGLAAEFQVKAVEHRRAVASSGVSLFVTAERVRFRWLNDQPDAGRPCPLSAVPPRVFSEVMRAIDLFVSVCSAGQADADRSDTGDLPAGIWRASARTRREVMRELLPRLSFVHRCRLSERFLIVRGDLHTYRIHLGSGHILRQDTNEEVTIPADREQIAPIALPFEGDRTLALILARARMLADDTRLRVPEIDPEPDDAVQTSLSFF